MWKNLVAVLQSLAFFTPEEQAEIQRYFRKKRVSKNDIVHREGDVCKYFYFVASGCIRIFFRDEKGADKTRYVLLPNHVGTALSSFISGNPATEWIEAACDSELLEIHHEDFYRLCAEMDAWKGFYLRMLELAYTFQNHRIEQLTTLTARQRYEQVLAQKPELIQHLSNRQLATYLDIREETLSRLKAPSARF